MTALGSALIGAEGETLNGHRNEDAEELDGASLLDEPRRWAATEHDALPLLLPLAVAVWAGIV